MTPDDELLCFARHVRAAGFCMRGAREWCALHGIAWSGFVGEGVPASKLLATMDVLAVKVVNIARREKGSPVVEQG